jgi:hypothetical protein
MAQLEETFRNWLYRVLTEFGVDVSDRLGNRITDTAIWSNSKADAVEQARLDTNNYLAGLIIAAPWPFDQAISWFMALACNYIVNPAFSAVRYVFIYASMLIQTLWRWDRMNYIPACWLLDIICHVRDRLVNLIDDTATLISNTQTWVTGLVNTARTYLQPAIDVLNNWRTDVSAWIGQNLYNPLMAVIGDITEIGTRLYTAEQSVLAITSDPVTWIWSHIEPYLRTKVEAWLNSIWYTRI